MRRFLLIYGLWLLAISGFAGSVFGIELLNRQDPAFEAQAFPPFWLLWLLFWLVLMLWLADRYLPKRWHPLGLAGLGGCCWLSLCWLVAQQYLPYWGNTWQPADIGGLLVRSGSFWFAGAGLLLWMLRLPKESA